MCGGEREWGREGQIAAVYLHGCCRCCGHGLCVVEWEGSRKSPCSSRCEWGGEGVQMQARGRARTEGGGVQCQWPWSRGECERSEEQTVTQHPRRRARAQVANVAELKCFIGRRDGRVVKASALRSDDSLSRGFDPHSRYLFSFFLLSFEWVVCVFSAH